MLLSIAAAAAMLLRGGGDHDLAREELEDPEGEPALVDVSEDAGVAEVSRTWSANVHDFDRDGWDDVLIVRHQERARLLRNERGRFEQAALLPRVDRHDCAWGDVNVDGRPDVFCSVGAMHGAGSNPNELWIQRPDGEFVDRAARYGVEDPYGRGRHTTFIDANGDRYPDLYVSNQFPRRDDRASINRLYVNAGGRRFRPAPEFRLNGEVGGKSVQAVDFDRDGDEDLLVCGEDTRGLRLYANEDGRRFREVAGEHGLERECHAGVLSDLDGDGWPDLVRVADRYVEIRLRRPEGPSFHPASFTGGLTNGRAVAVGRVDRDSLRDVYVLQRGQEGSDTNDVLLLNRDRGRSFEPAPIPQDREGRGNAVAAIDHDRDGRDAFIVLDGEGSTEGPVRLLAPR